MPQTQVGASESPPARLPGWVRQDPANSPAALHPLAALDSPMAQAEMAQADVAQAEDGSPTAFHPIQSVLAQGTRTPRSATPLPSLGGNAGSPASRGLIGRQGKASGCAFASPPGAP